MQENSLILLFLKERAAEEIKLTFAKAKAIMAFSFLFGEDFNFFIATNASIDIYKVKPNKQKAKLVKSIPHPIPLDALNSQVYYETMSNTILVVDNKG